MGTRERETASHKMLKLWWCQLCKALFFDAGVYLNQTGVIRFRLHADAPGEGKLSCRGPESEVAVIPGEKEGLWGST